MEKPTSALSIVASPLALVLLALFGIAALLPAVTVSAADCNEAGSLTRETYLPAGAARTRYFTLYLPPCYENSQQSYPLLMLLHGSNADDRQWLRLGFINALEAAIQSGASPPMILVLPFGDAIANENAFGGNSYGSLLIEQLDHARQRYRSDGRTAIGGISRGGFWAYHLGLRFPGRFVAIGGHSPFFDPSHVEPRYNPLELARTQDLGADMRLWLDRGSRDFAAAGVDRMHVILRDRDVDHQYVVYSGAGHDEASWERHISDYLAFYSAAFMVSRPSNSGAERRTETGRELWIPAAAFAALQTSIGRDQLDEILAGAFDPRLTLSESAARRLREHGIELHRDTRIVEGENLERQLWRDKLSFTLLPFDQLRLRLRPLWLDGKPVVDQIGDYPLIFDRGAPNYHRDSLTRITLSGTTALARGTRTAIDAIGLEAAASGIRDYVSASDYFHVTNEAPLADACPQFSDKVLGGANSLCMKREHASLFDILNVDVVDMTGNHINDFGYDAFEDTLTLFEETGIKAVGAGRSRDDAGKPLLLSHNGNNVAWLACNAIGPYYALVNEDPSALGGARPGAAFCDRAWLEDYLPVLAAQNDLVLLTIHYQEFESYTPTAGQRADFRAFAEWGADVVIGTAEHKPMTFEFYRTRRGETAFIHFGLGNLYFDQNFWGNKRFFLDTLYVYAGKLVAVELFPGLIDDRARPRLLTGDDQFNFLHYMMIQQNGF
ncbi:MAG: CapA family protein [Chloroflexota bacterium]|nr:CapA family protein [Chloroflexota bacterium]